MAKPFKFKLEPVARYRERIEDAVKMRFAEIQAVRHQKMTEIELVQQQARDARESMGQSKQGALDVPRLKMLNRYITGLAVTELQKQGELRVIDVEVEKRRQEFVRARQDVRVMEKLKERKLAEHDYAENLEQTKVYDEMATQKVIAVRREAVLAGERDAGGVLVAAGRLADEVSGDEHGGEEQATKE